MTLPRFIILFLFAMVPLWSLTACASTQKKDDEADSETIENGELKEGEIPPPDGEELDPLTNPEGENGELPELKPEPRDLSESDGWSMDDPTETLPTEQDLAPAAESMPIPFGDSGAFDDSDSDSPELVKKH